jgi:multiple sugar transport system permease protein
MYTIRKVPTFFISIMFPAIVLVGSFVIYPVINGIYLSFTNYSPTSPILNWVSLENYIYLLGDPEFWEVVLNTLVIVFISTLLAVIFGFGLALLLDTGLKWARFFRTAIFQIWVVPWISISIVWGWMFNVEYGIVNWFLVLLGIIPENFDWVFDAHGAKFLIISGYTWRAIPFMMVVSLAAIRSVPRDILDASSIDGADYFRRVFFVIIPLLRNIILTMALLQAVRFFQEMTMPFILTEGGPGNATMVLSMYTYKLAFTYWDFGLASTVGTVWLVFLVIFGFIYVRLFFKKID